MLFTRVWSVCLGLGVAALVAVLLLVAHGRGGTFSTSDERAVRAMAEAALIAVQAELHAAAVTDIVEVHRDREIREALVDEASRVARGRALPQRLAEVAERLRLRTRSDLTLAVVDRTEGVMAANGVDEQRLEVLFEQPPFSTLAPDEQASSSVILQDKAFFAVVTESADDGSRIAAIAPVPTDASSLLRRAVGTDYPAAIVRGDEVLMSFNLGTASHAQFVELVATHFDDVPDQGASRTFSVGDGPQSRLGALGRLPGAAGRGERGAVVAVLSDRAASGLHGGVRDLLVRGWERGLPVRDWLIVVGIASLAFAILWVVPRFEITEPAERLLTELREMLEGRQHQVFHERYYGIIGRIAGSVAALHESQRSASARDSSVSEAIHIGDSVGDSVGDAVGDSTSTPSLIEADEHPTGVHTFPAAASRPATSSPAFARPSTVRTPRTPPASMTTPSRSTSVALEPVRGVDESTGDWLANLDTPQARAPVCEPDAERPSPMRTAPQPPSTPRPRPATPSTLSPKWRALYEEFSAVKAECGEPLDGLSYDKFVRRLEQNEAALRARRREFADIHFAVYVKNGRAAIKAKVVREVS